jgi:short subunit dehydrogenase-like uncharacterized protein
MLAVIGATGYTGRLVVEEARRAGLPLRLVGRRRDALDELAREGDEVRVADATDGRGLREALDGAFAVASIAGPFLEIGYEPVAAAIDVGVHYLDITGEQEFTRRVYEEFGPRAADRGLVLLSAFGMDYVPGDLAARIAAEGLAGAGGRDDGEPLDEIAVAYSFSGAGTSRGTKKTVALMAGRPHLAWVDGKLVESRLGETSRIVPFPFGEKECIEWGGTEPLTVTRHTRVRQVRSYARLPKAAAKAAPLAGPALKLRAKFASDGPSPEERAAARTAVVAVARRGDQERVAALTGSDPYGFTALAIVRGVQALQAGEARGVGALAPAEAFDARDFLSRLAPLLVLASG